MAGVFVSYRRDDSQGFAGRLTDDLADILGDERVFRDVEIPIGSDFTDVLHRAIAASDALLVVIGRAWATRGSGGFGDRLAEETDWVRTEIEAAFAQRKIVIPVLIGGARMPSADTLPPSLRQLSVLQAAELTDRHWDAEVEALADRLQALCPALAEDRPSRDREESPAEVLRDLLGERLREEVANRRRPRITVPSMPPTFSARLLGGIWRGLRKFLGSALLVAAVYVGLRLLGDDDILRALDAFEARLQIGWERLQGYIARI
ncbi:MAG: toll/interleukin-1 receptor domain-containing protein [Gammaproteobacteria bacterium]|nr:toll/interleukin-1 receptor domain-containing protein [Gammaproteobacteria bacterium]